MDRKGPPAGALLKNPPALCYTAAIGYGVKGMLIYDVDELHTAAIDLLTQVMALMPARFSYSQQEAFRAAVFEKLINFVHTDVPCTLEQSQKLFAECLRSSPLSSIPSKLVLENKIKVAKRLLPKMCFNLHNSSARVKFLEPDVQLKEVVDEVERCHAAVLKNKDYRPQRLFGNLLSIESDDDNKKVLMGYYRNLRDTNKMYSADPFELAQYVDEIVRSVHRLQMMLTTPHCK